MHRALTLIAPVMLSLGIAPAHAAGSVITEATATASDVGTQLLATALCDARATAGATATTVSCKISNRPDGVDGVGITRSFPGGVAVAEVQTFTGHPAYVCHSAFAVFLDGQISWSPQVCDRIAP